MAMASNRVLVSYEGQPPTCYGCNDIGHKYHECPRRRQMNNQQNTQSQLSWAEVVTPRTMHPQTGSAQNMTATKQVVPPSDPKEAPSNLPHGNEASPVQTTTVDMTLQGKAQTSKGNADDTQIDDSLTGLIVDTDDPQDTQAEIMSNNTTTRLMPPPQNPLDIDTGGNVGHSERDTYNKQHETSMEKGTCDLHYG